MPHRPHRRPSARDGRLAGTFPLGIACLAVAVQVLVGADARAENSMEEACRQEVHELHQFFQDWFNGTLENSDESFGRLAAVIDSEFVMVTPEGRMTGHDALLAGLRRAHGQWKENGITGRIWIENFKLHRMAGEFAVVTYEEWQETGDGKRARLSSAVFGRREGAPAGIAWLHLHEVWMTPAGE